MQDKVPSANRKVVTIVSDVDSRSQCRIRATVEDGGVAQEAPETLLDINPADAEQRGVRDRDWVAVCSPRGEIRCRARMTDDIKAGVVHLAFGCEEANANILTDNAAFDPVTGSTDLKSLLCQVACAADKRVAAGLLVNIAGLGGGDAAVL
jgi:anaerobic selenocysteine-containing dehydrogenase